MRWGELVHSDPDISGVNLTAVEKFLCEEVIVTKLCNWHSGAESVSESLFDSVGVMFDRSVSVCCDASLRAGRYRGALISERRLGLLLVFCGSAVLNSIPVQHTNSGGLEPPMYSSRAVKAALGSVLAVSPAGLCTTEQKGSPWLSDSHMGPALSWR